MELTEEFENDIFSQEFAYQYGGELMNLVKRGKKIRKELLEVARNHQGKLITKSDDYTKDWDIVQWSTETDKLYFFDYDLVVLVPKTKA